MFPSIQQPSAGVGLSGDPPSSSTDTFTPVSRPFHLEMKRALAGSPGQVNGDRANPSNTAGPQEVSTGPGVANPGQKTRDTDSDEPRKHSSESRSSATADSDPSAIPPVDPLQLLATAVVAFMPIPAASTAPSPQLISANPVGQGGAPVSEVCVPGSNGLIPQSTTDAGTGTKVLPKATQTRETAVEKTVKPLEHSVSPQPTTTPGTTGLEPGIKTPESQSTSADATTKVAADSDAKLPEATVQAGPAPPPAKANPMADLTRRIPAAPTISASASPPVEPKGGGPMAEVSPPLGTSAAQQELSMKKAENGPKTAELAQQNLPSAGAVTAAPEQARPTAQAQSDVSALTSSSTSDTARQLSLERTHDLVATHSLRLSQSGNDSLRVVIEPGSGTRLSLELRLNNGAVEVQAQLHRGDFEFMSHHWAELQQRLEPRGVHLAALENPADSSTGQPNSEQRGRQPAEEQPTRSAFAEFAFDDSMVDSPAKRRGRAKRYAGWESWA